MSLRWRDRGASFRALIALSASTTLPLACYHAASVSALPAVSTPAGSHGRGARLAAEDDDVPGKTDLPDSGIASKKSDKARSPSQSDSATSPAGAPHGLDAFYDALRRAELHRRDGRVNIVELGDSHTAGEGLTRIVRRRLWERFGDAGRGYLLPGKPKKHYYQRDADYGSTGPWENERGLHRDQSEPFGMAGLRVHSASPDASAWVGTCHSCTQGGGSVARFEISYHPRSDGGRLAFRVDEEPWQELDTRSAAPANTAWTEVTVADGPHRLSFHPTGNGPVDLFGIALERDLPGVILDSVGVVGARALHLWRWDWTYVGEQLAHRDPRLVILQYGTNETDERDLDLARFENQLVELVQRVKTAAPGASVLLLGPPDRGKRERRDCDPPKRKKKGKQRAQNRGGPDRRTLARLDARHAPGKLENGKPAPGCEWLTPQILLDVIDAERRAAERAGVPFFDLYAAMGGRDQFESWVHAVPPLGHTDRVHLTGKGYERAAELLLAMLLDGYELWLKTAPPLPPDSASPGASGPGPAGPTPPLANGPAH